MMYWSVRDEAPALRVSGTRVVGRREALRVNGTRVVGRREALACVLFPAVFTHCGRFGDDLLGVPIACAGSSTIKKERRRGGHGQKRPIRGDALPASNDVLQRQRSPAHRALLFAQLCVALRTHKMSLATLVNRAFGCVVAYDTDRELWLRALTFIDV